ncbi:M23 family metallopeptidase [Mucispirillum schaedleri]|uniref:M23 family metallopeptidase n=1 Tax=Mucispirillum schaedleri TaxID=248039 RepID=UPI001F56025D|nr:M23 family metallopeptidase [Mucispirillum schaedleri]
MGNGYKTDNNVYTFSYCHLKEFDHKLIGTKKEVKAGDLIGYTGSSGNAKGSDSPHLHIEIRSIGAEGLGGLDKKINPACFFDFKYPSNEIAPCNKWSDHKSIDDFFQIKIHIKNILKQILQSNMIMLQKNIRKNKYKEEI